VATTFYENYPNRVLALVLEDGGSVPVWDMVDLLDRIQAQATHPQEK